ncbi:MAG: methyl-accepting chemotaxis protein [Zoogloeaceae bacterium]|jgi:twitching motility protein PilJ|nr:methyl-accepting chemotaxis protein [Zoogloeaceae bacterium]
MALFGKKKPASTDDMSILPEYSANKRSEKARQVKNAHQQRRWLVSIFSILVVVIGVLVFMANNQSTNNTTYVAAAGDLRMLSQHIAKLSSQVMLADPDAGAPLRKARQDFSELLQRLTVGGVIKGVDVPPSPANAELDALKAIWSKVEKDTNILIAQETKLANLSKGVAFLLAGNRELLEQTEKVASGRFGGSTREAAVVSQMLMMTQRIAKNARLLIGIEKISPEATLFLAQDANTFSQSLEYLANNVFDSAQREHLGRLSTLFNEHLKVISGILPDLHQLNQSKEAGANIIRQSDDLLKAADDLAAAYQRESSTQVLMVVMLVVGIFAIFILFRLFTIYRADERRRTAEAEEQREVIEALNQQNQNAILRLMNELGDLADGDLTTTATVSEDITGAIADSINYTIEELRGLVGRINDAATQVTQMTEIARKTSAELLEAARQQSNQINAAGDSAVKMVQSMNNVSTQANQSAEVARASLAAAQNGVVAVEDSIRSMNEIRGQIQETAKRIKRLGESSQEIGEIVELISDITEQTNVLALNAAIQAASAGEAGRGFTVVAEEVQRLAERSAEATKQISALVKTIQTDTQEAVSAMEKSTQGVVEGAKRSDVAGQALTEIGTVSNNLASLIEHISAATQEQSKTATRVASLMQEILSITERTSTGTSRTSETVEKLATLAAELKGSVAGFKVS